MCLKCDIVFLFSKFSQTSTGSRTPKKIVQVSVQGVQGHHLNRVLISRECADVTTHCDTELT